MDDRTDDATAREPMPSASFDPGRPPSTTPETPPGFLPGTGTPSSPSPEQPAVPPLPGLPAAPMVAPPASQPASRDAHPRWRTDEGRWAAVFFGLVLLVVGLWFFAEKTLGLTMPDIDVGQFWPVILIVLGVWVLLAGFRRDRR